MIKLGDGLELALDSVTDTFAILGIRGSGKTNTSVVMAEQMIRAHLCVAIIDPLDVWWGLRSLANGKSSDLAVYVFGGRHADVPLEPTAGAVIGQWMISERRPAILSLKHLTHADQARFMTDFALTLYRHNTEPIHVIIDEAARLVPQNIRQEPLLAKCVGAVQDLGSEGRASGIGTTVIGQRAARINKDVLTQATTLIAMQTVSALDRKAIEEWIGEHGTPEARKEMMSAIASLPVGTGFFYAPSRNILKRVRFQARTTFDSSATPKVGKLLAQPAERAPVDLEKLKGEIAASVERAEAHDPKCLWSVIHKLRRELAAAQKPPVEIARIEVPVFSAEDIAALQSLFATAAERAQAVLATLERAVAGAKTAGDALQRPPVPAPPPRQFTSHAAMTAPALSGPGLGQAPGARRMLIVLAMRGVRLSRRELGALSGVKATGGSFGSYLSRLRASGLVETTGDYVWITPAGLASVEGAIPPTPQTTEEIVAQWAAKLSPGSKRMLDVVIAEHPNRVSKVDLGERAQVDPRGGSFGTYLSRLKSMGLVDADRNDVWAQEILFP